MSFAVGGKYAALMGGKKQKQNNNNGAAGAAAGAKPKAAKVISLKDTAEKNPPPQATHTEAKKHDAAKKPAAKAPERDLTRREAKNERGGDRHVPRSGIADHTKEKKNEQVAEALEAANEKPSDAMGEKRREFEEREAERKKRDEEEQKKVTYADYQKTLDAKKAELAEINKAKERKIDAKSFAALTEMKKDETPEFFKLAKAEEKVAAKVPEKKAPAKKGAEVPQAPAKKNKFRKSADVQLGFFSKPAQAPRAPRGDFNRGPRTNGYHGKQENKTEEDKPAAEAAPADAQEETPAAEVATEAAAAADEW